KTARRNERVRTGNLDGIDGTCERPADLVDNADPNRVVIAVIAGRRDPPDLASDRRADDRPILLAHEVQELLDLLCAGSAAPERVTGGLGRAADSQRRDYAETCQEPEHAVRELAADVPVFEADAGTAVEDG